jgi:hypothetical protein
VILSYIWENGQEVTFQDLRDGIRQSKAKYGMNPSKPCVICRRLRS